MVIYLDQAFALNALADGLALYITAQAAGLPIRRGRLLGAAGLGGLYGAVCLLPPLAALGGFLPRLAAAAALVRMTFGGGEHFLRRFLLFYVAACTMGGALVAAGPLLRSGRGWGAFFLAGGACYGVLSLLFRGDARHAAAGQLCRGAVERQGRRAELTALLDTGHTLTDNGRPVLIGELGALRAIWSGEEWAALQELERQGSAACLEKLAAVSPGAFRLLPYRAVGVSAGMLLCCRAERLVLDGKDQGPVTVAISPTPVSDGGGYTALWGGEQKTREARHAA